MKIDGLNVQSISGRKAEATFAWGDGVYTFRLPVDSVLELQEKTDCGPYELLDRFRNNAWRIQDIRETIRIALIGGGVKPPKAFALVQRYVDKRPMAENVPACLVIMTAAVLGVPGDEPGKSKGARAPRARRSRTEGSARPKSTSSPEPQA
jgi:hypothetical protein